MAGTPPPPPPLPPMSHSPSQKPPCAHPRKDASQRRPRGMERRLQRILDQVKHWGDDFHRTKGEEWANFGTHFAGAVFSVFALTFMCVKTGESGNPRHVVAAAIYGTTLLVLYSASALYHLMRRWKVKGLLQTFDHVSIYLLIAGSYTPFALVTLKDGSLGTGVLAVTWTLAALGILAETVVKPRREWLTLLVTLAMGWEALFFFKPLAQTLNLPGLVLLLVGGGLYTLGVPFYAMDRIPYMHTVWHAFVLAASVCHWVAIQFSVLV